MSSSSSSSSFLAVPSTSAQHPINNDHYNNNNNEEEDDEDDDDATIGLRTPTLSSTSSSSSPYSSPAHNISQATILPPPSHTYTSLGSHLSLEHPLPSPLPLPTSPSPPTATPPPSSFLNKLHNILKQTPLSIFKHSPSSSPESLSSLSLFTLTLALAGAQLSWTLELAYGNIFLLSLGLSKSHSALVWLAGPLSGLIAQPLIGAWSDRIAPSSKWRIVRRRVFLIISGVIIVLSTLLLAFVQPCARWLVDAILRIGEADWDPDRLEAVDSATKFLAILAFWILDLALNALQASARALILDVAPRQQQSQANAWHGRMTHAGNVVGYAAGWMDLGSLHALSWLGGGQFRKLAVVSLVGMGVCVAVTCLCTTEGGPAPPSREQEEEEVASLRADIERPRRPTTSSKRKPKPTKKKKRKKKQASQNALFALLSHISKATRTLPQPIARVCLVQLFAFSSWFPFLFFSTTYVVELQRRGHKGGDGNGNGDKDTERGSFAMMLYAIVALGAGGILPYLAVASGRKKTTPSPTMAQSEDAGQPPITETAGGTVIYQRAVEEGGSSPSMSTAVLDEEHQEEEVQQLGFTSFIEHERRHSSSEPAREEDEEEEEEDSPLLPQQQQQQQQHSAGLLHNWTLRSLWTLGGILTFVLLTLGTSLIPLLIEDEKMQVRAAMGVVGLMGVPWAVASWVPFALLGEFLKEAEEVVSEPEEEEEDEGRTRESVRDALVDCRPLPSGRGVPSSSSSSKTRVVSASSSSSRKNGKARRPAPPRRQASDLLPNEMSTHSSSDEDEDEEPIRRNSSSGAGGLRVLPTSEAYTRRLEEEELRRASAARRRMRQRQMDEEEAEERRRDLESDEEEDVSGEDQDEEEEEEGDEGEGEGERVRKDEGGGGKKGSSAGTILGIHNLAIVLPQFFVALIANLIFRLSSSEDGGDGVVWVLRFGGVMGLLAAFATRFVPLTRTEREDERLRRRSRRSRSKSKSKRARRMSAGVM